MAVGGGVGDKCIWVTRPVPGGGAVSSSEEEEEVVTQADGGVVPIPTDLILCHICERTIPALAFQLHNDACSEVHRAEMDIGMINDGLLNARGLVDERTILLRREMEKFDEGEVGQDAIVRAYLFKLYNMGIQVLRVIDAVLAIATRQGDDEENGENGDGELEWECPPQSYFYPPNDEACETPTTRKSGTMLQVPKQDGNSWPSCTLVDAALSEIGVGIYNLASTVSELVASKREVLLVGLIIASLPIPRAES
jgi:hypothetical protein